MKSASFSITVPLLSSTHHPYNKKPRADQLLHLFMHSPVIFFFFYHYQFIQINLNFYVQATTFFDILYTKLGFYFTSECTIMQAILFLFLLGNRLKSTSYWKGCLYIMCIFLFFFEVLRQVVSFVSRYCLFVDSTPLIVQLLQSFNQLTSLKKSEQQPSALPTTSTL